MENDNINKLITNFLKNEVNEQEQSDVLLWVKESEENKQYFKEQHQVFLANEYSRFKSTVDIDKSWGELKNKMQKKGKRQVIQSNNLLKIAASIVIVLNIALAAYLITNTKNDQSLVKVEVPRGEKSKVTLPDGTLVWLNSESTLSYNAKNSRQVFLNGEAFFDVTKDPKNFFEVNTPYDIKVRVLGTKFNLKAYQNESMVETTLEEGKVNLLRKNNKVLTGLAPGEQAIFKVGEKRIEIENVDTELYSLWKDNIFKIESMPFENLVKRLEHWYGVSIKLDEKLKGRDSFTFTVKTASLRELLQMMQLTSEFNYTIDGSEVSIYAK